MSFINPKSDFAFKKIFSSEDSVDILISFLNAILYTGKPHIADLEIINPYSAGRIVSLKDSYLDVKARLSNGTNVIIEMQILNVSGFGKRVVYNAAKAYVNQLKVSEGYLKLKPVISVAIADFEMFGEQDDVISKFVFKEEEKLFNYFDDTFNLVFVELSKFEKTLEQLETITDKWLYFMKTAPSLELIPENMGNVPEIQKAFNIANRANLSLEELEDLEKREMFIMDQQGSAMKAIEIGLEKGRIQGEIQGQTKLILRQLNKSLGELNPEIVEQIQSLSTDQLESLGEAVLEIGTIEALLAWLQNR